jgi:hypothetical protein
MTILCFNYILHLYSQLQRTFTSNGVTSFINDPCYNYYKFVLSRKFHLITSSRDRQDRWWILGRHSVQLIPYRMVQFSQSEMKGRSKWYLWIPVNICTHTPPLPANVSPPYMLFLPTLVTCTNFSLLLLIKKLSTFVPSCWCLFLSISKHSPPPADVSPPNKRNDVQIQCLPLNRITLGPHESDKNIIMIPFTGFWRTIKV